MKNLTTATSLMDVDLDVLGDEGLCDLNSAHWPSLAGRRSLSCNAEELVTRSQSDVAIEVVKTARERINGEGLEGK